MLTQTNLTIKILTNILKLIIKKRKHIYTKNRIIILKFKKIVNKHFIIWTN
jgi:hypothetical protein